MFLFKIIFGKKSKFFPKKIFWETFSCVFLAGWVIYAMLCCNWWFFIWFERFFEELIRKIWFIQDKLVSQFENSWVRVLVKHWIELVIFDCFIFFIFRQIFSFFSFTSSNQIDHQNSHENPLDYTRSHRIWFNKQIHLKKVNYSIWISDFTKISSIVSANQTNDISSHRLSPHVTKSSIIQWICELLNYQAPKLAIHFFYLKSAITRPACAKTTQQKNFYRLSSCVFLIHSNLSSSYSILNRNKSKVKLKWQIEAFSSFFIFHCSTNAKKFNLNRKVSKVKVLINFIDFPKHLFQRDDVWEVGFGLWKSLVFIGVIPRYENFWWFNHFNQPF